MRLTRRFALPISRSPSQFRVRPPNFAFALPISRSPCQFRVRPANFAFALPISRSPSQFRVRPPNFAFPLPISRSPSQFRVRLQIPTNMRLSFRIASRSRSSIGGGARIAKPRGDRQAATRPLPKPDCQRASRPDLMVAQARRVAPIRFGPYYGLLSEEIAES